MYETDLDIRYLYGKFDIRIPCFICSRADEKLRACERYDALVGSIYKAESRDEIRRKQILWALITHIPSYCIPCHIKEKKYEYERIKTIPVRFTRT